MLRAGYGIEGSVMGDICVPLFCLHCVTAQMLHEVRARGPIRNPSLHNEQWRHGLCSFDMTACLLGLCIPNCGLAMAREKYDGSSMCLNCLCLPPALGRNLIREGYGIEGDCCKDICASMFLLPCVVSQLYQETKARGNVHNSGVGPRANTMR
jgi:Cys-rich protein (TIGR01571 family)